jgi:hypothetical protein
MNSRNGPYGPFRLVSPQMSKAVTVLTGTGEVFVDVRRCQVVRRVAR